eukprot:gene25317-biopygen11985
MNVKVICSDSLDPLESPWALGMPGMDTFCVHFQAFLNFTGAPECGEDACWTPRLTALERSHRYSHGWFHMLPTWNGTFGSAGSVYFARGRVKR